MYGLDMINTSVLGALGCDMNTFLRYFPAAETMYKITYTTSMGTRTYLVETVTKISSSDWSYLSSTTDNRMTLLTCVAGDSSQRWCVQAVQAS